MVTYEWKYHLVIKRYVVFCRIDRNQVKLRNLELKLLNVFKQFIKEPPASLLLVLNRRLLKVLNNLQYFNIS